MIRMDLMLSRFCIFLFLTIETSIAYSLPIPAALASTTTILKPLTLPRSSGKISFSLSFAVFSLRGGNASEQQQASSTDTTSETNIEAIAEVPKSVLSASSTSIPAACMMVLSNFGTVYADSLARNPIITKSVTAGFIFALSDVMAQRLEKPSSPKLKQQRQAFDWVRILSSGAVGLFYFGPAAHYWYDMVFRLFPATSLVSTLQKAALGQMFFGPTFTCIFFATGLLQSKKFTFANWISKIRTDLPGVWLAGAGFWVIVDLISFSVLSKQWIPLFVNMCSLVWTTYLVLRSYA